MISPGSLFNHSRTPNVSYTLDRETESIRYTTTHDIHEGDELCIFYGHKLWFEDADAEVAASSVDEHDDGWGGLSSVDNDNETDSDTLPTWLGGPDAGIVPEDQLPFVRLKLVDDEAEDQVENVRAGEPTFVDLATTTDREIGRARLGD